jgi:hypothetical protein
MRREHNASATPLIQLPNKLFCFDFEDTNANTTLKVTDTVYGQELTKAAAGSIEFINDPDFGRCIKTTSRLAANVYTADWYYFIKTIAGNTGFAQENWAQRPMTLIWFGNSMGTNSYRSGLLSNYNQQRFSGYQGYSGSLSYVASSVWGTLDVYRCNYVGKTAASDLAMFVVGSDYPNMKRIRTKYPEDIGFTSLEELTTAYTPYSPTTGTLKLFCSQETSYYHAAGGICAGITLYDGLLTNEQVAYIFNNKII